jgi:hypothetical protein
MNGPETLHLIRRDLRRAVGERETRQPLNLWTHRLGWQ